MSKSYIDQVEEEYDNSEIAKRINVVEQCAMNHGYADYKGQTMKSFLRKSLAGQAENIISNLEKRRDEIFFNPSLGGNSRGGFNEAINYIKEKYAK